MTNGLRNSLAIGLVIAAGATVACSTTCSVARIIPPMVKAKAPPMFGEHAYAHIAKLCSFGPRYVGSAGWKKGVDYIAGQIAAMGITPIRDTWYNGKERLTFVNVHCTLPGRTKDRIVIGCHHDTKKCIGHPDPAHNFRFLGANDSGSGVGLMLELIRQLKDQEGRMATYEFVFLDGEESIPWKWDHTRALFGSRRFVRNYVQAMTDRPETTPKVGAFLLLDMVGAKDLQIDYETNSNPLMRSVVGDAAKLLGHDEFFYAKSLDCTDDHIPFLDEGIPALDLIDFEDNPHWHTAEDTLSHLSAQSLRIVGEVVLTALPILAAHFVDPPQVQR